MISIRIRSVDCLRGTKKTFKTLAGARKFAVKMLGPSPEMGSWYAVSHDGITTIGVIEGCKLDDLFPQPDEEVRRELSEQEVYEAEERRERESFLTEALEHAAEMERLYPSRPRRSPGCICDDTHLMIIGCDCASLPGRPYRTLTCTCTDEQLTRLGCDCGDLPF